MVIAVPVACAVVAVAVIIVAATLMLFIYKHKKISTTPCKLCPSKFPVLTCTPCILFTIMYSYTIYSVS